jgi:hypothetical protein
MIDDTFTITVEHELAAGGLPQRAHHQAHSPGGLVAIIAAVIEQPGFRSLTVDVEADEQELAIAA